MGEQLKFIVDRLNDEPFKKNLNLISFDSLLPIQLLQVLNDIMSEINPQETSNLKEEDPEQRILRMLNFLKVMKFKPKADDIGNSGSFQQGLMLGEKPVVYPIIQWLLERGQDLKKRAYLARYLVKLDVPHGMLIDNEVTDTHAMYLELIEQFKTVHKETDQIRDSGISAGEIKKDILSMEQEQEQLRKRIERQKKRVDAVANKDKMLHAAKNKRLQDNEAKNLAEQKQTQRNQLSHIEQKLSRVHTQLRDLRASSIGMTAEGLLKRLGDENQVNSFLTQEKLPKECDAKKNYLTMLQKVANEPAMGQGELDKLNNTIAELSSDVNGLVEKRMMQNNPMDDKLSVFRQQAAVISNKKNTVAETLQETMDEFNSVESEVKERRAKLKDSDGGEVINAEEFKRYVSKLRTKSNAYKEKRAEVAEVQSEVGVLSRTDEILKSRAQQSQAHLSSMEAKHGISGFHATQEELEKVSTMKSELDEQKGKTLEEMSQLVVQLTKSIAEKKIELAPGVKELRPLRQRCQEVTTEYEDKKGVYETTSAGLESNMAKLEQEVKSFQEEVLAEQRRYHLIDAKMELLEFHEERIDEEIKLYVANEPSKKSLRDQYSQKIHEQETLGKSLKEQQKTIRESHGPNLRQMKMWSDLSLLMKAKKDIVSQNAQRNDSPGAVHYEQDHLVL